MPDLHQLSDCQLRQMIEDNQEHANEARQILRERDEGVRAKKKTGILSLAASALFGGSTHEEVIA